MNDDCECGNVKAVGDSLCSDCRWIQNMQCNVCGCDMEHRAVYVFGDESLGVEQEWLECLQCSQRKYRIARGYWA